MTPPDFDFIVIGGGSAGYAGATTAARHGLKTLVIEGGQEVGGLCILRGCMPSKALLESAHRAEAIRHAADFGLRAEYRGADGTAIRERKRRLIAEFADYRRHQLGHGNFELLRGAAKFVDQRTVEVRLLDGGSRQITARSFLIATGSIIGGPEIPGLREIGYWTSDDLLDSEEIPGSVCVLGGGAIALEAASYYCGLGVATTVIQRGRQVLKEVDADVAEAATDALEKRGVQIFRETQLVRADRCGAQKRVHFIRNGEARSIAADQIVYALGRKPAIDGLELANAEVPVSKGGIVANSHQQCGPGHIFAAGDVCGPHEIVHVAIHQAELAARNAARILEKLGGALEMIAYDLKLFVVFTQPQIAAVGLSEREAEELNYDFAVAKYPFAEHGKAQIHGETNGFVKLIAERTTKRLLGGACVGPDAAELIHEIVVALHFGSTAGDLARIPHYHPTLSEIWTYPAEELAG